MSQRNRSFARLWFVLICFVAAPSWAADLPLDASWQQVTTGGATIKLDGGAMQLDAPADSKAQLQHPAGSDQIAVTATVIRWSWIELVWDADNRCGVGLVSPTPFGRYSTAVVTAGKPIVVDHHGTNFGSPHRVRIRLGANYVQFLASDDGKNWELLRTIARPSQFSGAPRQIVIGKPQGDDQSPPRMDGRISNVQVDSLAVDESRLTDAQLAELTHPPVEPVNALLTQSANDPTFDQVAAKYPAMKFPREVVGVPAHPLDIGVDWLGRFDVSPWTAPTAWFEIGSPGKPLGEEGKPFQRRLLDGYLPLITLRRTIDDVDYELSIFGWSQDFRTDQDLFAYARLIARPKNGTAAPKQISLVWDNGKQRHAFSSDTAQWFVRFKYTDPASAVAIDQTEFDAKWNTVAQMWRDRIKPATRFDLPDARVMEAYRAWIAYSQLNSDTINGYLEPHDGAGFYEEMFGYSVALHSVAMSLYGLHDWAGKVLDTQIHFQQADGLYTQACGLCDPGSFLFGLAEHYRLTGDRAWLQRVSPAMVKQCDWLIKQRETALKDGVVRGLIKFRPYNDYPAPVYNYLGNALCAKGMERAAEAMKEIGAPQAAEYADEAAKYRQDILDSMKAAAFDRDGQTLLPMEPDTHRLLKMGKYHGGDYYGLVASPLLEVELFPPDDMRANWVVDALEKRNGLIAGVCEFDCGIDHAYTYGYLLNAMQRDEVRKTLLGFWSFLAFGMTRDTYSPVEVTMIATGENQYTLPHLYSCTQQLRLLRTLLLREDGDLLWIGQGIPRTWLEPGQHVAATAAPTEFGDVNFRIDALADGTMQVHIEPPTRRPPAEIRLRLRQPHDSAIASVSGASASFTGETIVLPHPAGPIDLHVQFAAN